MPGALIYSNLATDHLKMKIRYYNISSPGYLYSSEMLYKLIINFTFLEILHE